MIFHKSNLPGAYLIEMDRHQDERGFFARTWCAREFADHGLAPDLAQCSISFNNRVGTLRGMHWQAEPHAEAKLVRCTAGSIYDVIVDLRPPSETYLKWEAFEIDATNRLMVYVPEGFAHGFLTRTDNAEVAYQISSWHVPESSRGARWNDPTFAIRWPADPTVISERDRNYMDFEH